MKKLTLMLTAILVSGFCYSQNIITGTITDEDGVALPGATVIVEGTSNGVGSDFDGNYSITAASGDTIVFSYIGYSSQSIAVGTSNTINVVLAASSNELDEVTLFSTLDLAEVRETPVAVSTLYASEIAETVGNLELPQLLNKTPGVYTTMQGAYGDATVRLRGFRQENIAVLINGMPVNDMENGAVYWSNWAGLSDVASAMQVQRGLGSSKLPIPSVGGTINVVTKSTALQQGGKVSASVGNDGFLKTVTSYNTGVSSSGHAFSASFGRTAGDGYVDGTSFEGYSYFLGYGYKDSSDKHNLQFVVTGAPQVHGQRTTSYYNMATLADYKKYGIKYNYNYGLRNGEGFNMRNNYYHKPIASLNWEYKINNKSSLSATAYASLGRGGGSGDLGRNGSFGFFSGSDWRNPKNGYVLWDQVVKHNSGQTANWGDGSSSAMSPDPTTGLFIVNDESFSSSAPFERRNGWIQRNSVNSHNWFGAIGNYKTKINENITVDVGFDSRFYRGLHYRNLRDRLGSDGYRDGRYADFPDGKVVTKEYRWPISDVWNVFGDTDKEEKIDRNNVGVIDYIGLYFQTEYSKDNLSVFAQGSVSNKGFQREDYYIYKSSNPLQISEKVNIWGGTIRVGANYNIDIKNNVFVNAGYFSKQPNLDAVFQNYQNVPTPDADLFNEKILGLEFGYGYRAKDLFFNVNLYRTTWTDRFLFENVEIGGERGEANFSGVEQIHSGIEIDGAYDIGPFVTVSAMLSLGNYKYGGNVTDSAVTTNESNVSIGSATLYLDDAKVGDTAHRTSHIDLTVRPTDRFKFNIDMFSAGDLYGSINAEDFDEPGVTNLKLPSYEIFGFGSSYKFELGENPIYIRLNVNNLFDNEYYQESANNYLATASTENYKGINVRNRVIPGWGRTWNLGFTYRF